MAERETPREDPLGTPPSLSAKKVSENLEKVPRIWEGEGSRRSEIMNASNNDYWVVSRLDFVSGSSTSARSHFEPPQLCSHSASRGITALKMEPL